MDTIWLKLQHLHPDWVVIGQVAALLGMGASLLMPAMAVGLWRAQRAMARERRQLQGQLARIFEQLDLMRLDAGEGAVRGEAVPAAAPTAAPAPPAAQREPGTNGLAGGEYRRDGSDYHTAARLAARGSSAAEIAERCGLVGGEARVLVALQQARARRAEVA